MQLKKKLYIAAMALFATVSASAQKTELNAGETLDTGTIVSQNKKFALSSNGNGQFSSYHAKDGGQTILNDQVRSSLPGDGTDITKLQLWDNGNLVLLNDRNEVKWASSTVPGGDPKFNDASLKPVKLKVDNAGFISLYSQSGEKVWSHMDAATAPNPISTTELQSGESLDIQHIQSKNKKFVLTTNAKGQFSVYLAQPDGTTPVIDQVRSFLPSPDDSNPVKLQLWPDGNLVVLDHNNQVKWASSTVPNGDPRFKDASLKPVKMMIEDDGTIALFNQAGKKVWYHAILQDVVATEAPAPAAPAPTPAPAAATASASVGLTVETVLEKMLALKSKYPDDMPWDNSNKYETKKNGGGYTGAGCAGFASILSDAAFDELPFEKHKDFNRIKVGDIVRINKDTHSVVVIGMDSEKVTLAEGNMGGKIKWGREIPVKEFKAAFDYAETRYP